MISYIMNFFDIILRYYAFYIIGLLQYDILKLYVSFEGVWITMLMTNFLKLRS